LSKKFIDLFSGIGGFRIALESNGEQCVYSSEWDKFARQTYEFNYSEIPDGDITLVDPNKIPDHDVLCAGFPCQAFSVSGKQRGFNDTRGTLFYNIANIAKQKKPRVLFLENVRNLYKHNNGQTIATIKRILNELDYDVHMKILNSSHYGVPQHRERIYIVCFKKHMKIGGFDFPMPSYKKISVQDILETNIKFSEYEIKRNDIKIFGNKLLDSPELFNNNLLRPIRVGTISKGGQGERIYSPLGHAITLSAHGGGVAGKTGAYLIDNKIRQLTEKECLRVQGFPDWFNFPDDITKSQKYKMCGNSVSVPVVNEIYKNIQLLIN
tara:strand:- start:698 stop:1669 length:972 start_codon:yes stop_codon:yes gene_type:complete